MSNTKTQYKAVRRLGRESQRRTIAQHIEDEACRDEGRTNEKAPVAATGFQEDPKPWELSPLVAQGSLKNSTLSPRDWRGHPVQI
jgi:hypothetical protein